MRWLDRLWPSQSRNDESLSAEVSSTLHDLPGHSPSNQYTTLETIALCGGTAAVTLLAAGVYRRHLRRIPTVGYLKSTALHKRSLYGYVTSVGDGDGFRFFHTPGGKMLGWGWAPRRRVQDLTAKELKDQTLSVRIAGIDAPEMAHFGKTAQPYAQEALDWLKDYVQHRYVRIWPMRKDQYERVVCSAERRRWLFFKSDIGYLMIRNGLATVYEAKFGSEYGNKEQQYRDAETRAKARKLGMWQEPGLVGRLLGKTASPVETPRQYKKRTATAHIDDMAK